MYQPTMYLLLPPCTLPHHVLPLTSPCTPCLYVPSHVLLMFILAPHSTSTMPIHSCRAEGRRRRRRADYARWAIRRIFLDSQPCRMISADVYVPGRRRHYYLSYFYYVSMVLLALFLTLTFTSRHFSTQRHMRQYHAPGRLFISLTTLPAAASHRQVAAELGRTFSVQIIRAHYTSPCHMMIFQPSP